MSCESKLGAISRAASRVSAGISALVSKRSFYAGVAVGAGGATGVMGLVKALRRPDGNKPQIIRGRGKIAGPQTGSRAKPRQIPKAALEAKKGSRVNPRPIPRAALETKKGSQSNNPRPIPKAALEAKKDRPGPALAAKETKLQVAPVQMQVGAGRYMPTKSYQVLRPDGSDTGLAITPYVRSGEDGRLIEDEQGWGVSHAGSGSLISGPYGSLSEAQDLAGRLSSVRWTRQLEQMPAEDVAQAWEVVEAYRRRRPATQAGDG